MDRIRNIWQVQLNIFRAQKFEDIKTFYYYKVCDSILELDISYNEDKVLAEQEKEESKKM